MAPWDMHDPMWLAGYLWGTALTIVTSFVTGLLLDWQRRT